jgi:hypothetical protein
MTDTLTLSDGREIDREAMIRWAWTHGILKYKMHSGQLSLDAEIQRLEGQKNRARPMLLWPRQTGKTTWEVTSFEEFARQNPGSIQRFAGPTQKQVVSTILPIWRLVAQDCPKDLRVSYSQREGCYVWPNGSRLFVAGTRTQDDVDRLRGPFSHRTYVDEMAFHQCDLDDLVNNVLSPQLNSTGGLLVQSTTPPISMVHSSVPFIRKAEQEGMAFTMDYNLCPLYTPEEVRRTCSLANPNEDEAGVAAILAGTKQGSPRWRREYLCELVPDQRLMVVPDFDIKKHVTFAHSSDAHTMRFVFIDQGGTVDFFAALFCEYDWRLHTLVVLADYQCKRTSTDTIAKALIAKEKMLGWLPPGGASTARRFANDPRGGQQVIDLRERNYYVVRGHKSKGPEAEADRLSVALREGRVIVHARCEDLIAQLRYGIWDIHEKTGRADYLRTPELGHLDALSALGSGLTQVPWRNAPPSDDGLQRLTNTENTEKERKRRWTNRLVFGAR